MCSEHTGSPSWLDSRVPLNDGAIPAATTDVPAPVCVAALAAELQVTPERIRDIVAGFVELGLFERADVEPLLTPDVAATVRVIVTGAR